MQGARAIADPVRRKILELLHAAPLPAGTIAKQFAISRPAVSKHLRILTECGVVEATTTGRHRIYALRTEPLTDVAVYLDRLLGPALPGKLDALATEVARTRRERRITPPPAPASRTKEETA